MEHSKESEKGDEAQAEKAMSESGSSSEEVRNPTGRSKLGTAESRVHERVY